MKKLISLCVAAVMAGSMFTACLEDKGPNTYTTQGYFTITEGMGGTRAYSDNGTYVNIGAATVAKNPALLNMERGVLLFQYQEDQVTQDGKGLNDPELLGYMAIPVADPMTTQQAIDTHILDTDSIYKVSKLDFWVYRGYITVAPTAYYGKTAPALNLVYNENSIANDSITLNVCYNIHNQAVAGNGQYLTSFRLDQFDALVPGGSDIVMTIGCSGVSNTTLKVKRADLHKGNWGVE